MINNLHFRLRGHLARKKVGSRPLRVHLARQGLGRCHFEVEKTRLEVFPSSRQFGSRPSGSPRTSRKLGPRPFGSPRTPRQPGSRQIGPRTLRKLGSRPLGLPRTLKKLGSMRIGSPRALRKLGSRLFGSPRSLRKLGSMVLNSPVTLKKLARGPEYSSLLLGSAQFGSGRLNCAVWCSDRLRSATGALGVTVHRAHAKINYLLID